MKKHVSYKGKLVDMELLKFQNQYQVAAGNASMNARGDILGKGGTIVKTNEQLQQERELRIEKEKNTNYPEQPEESSTESDLAFHQSDIDFLSDSENQKKKTIKRPKSE